MGLTVELVDLHCLVEVAGLAVLPRLVEEVALADFQRCVEEAGSAGSQRFVEVAGSVVPQRFVEEAGLAGSAMVVEFLVVEQNWFPRLPQNMREGILD
jgi:hypothetical protein